MESICNKMLKDIDNISEYSRTDSNEIKIMTLQNYHRIASDINFHGCLISIYFPLLVMQLKEGKTPLVFPEEKIDNYLKRYICRDNILPNFDYTNIKKDKYFKGSLKKLEIIQNLQRFIEENPQFTEIIAGSFIPHIVSYHKNDDDAENYYNFYSYFIQHGDIAFAMNLLSYCIINDFRFMDRLYKFVNVNYCHKSEFLIIFCDSFLMSLSFMEKWRQNKLKEFFEKYNFDSVHTLFIEYLIPKCLLIFAKYPGFTGTSRIPNKIDVPEIFDFSYYKHVQNALQNGYPDPAQPINTTKSELDFATSFDMKLCNIILDKNHDEELQISDIFDIFILSPKTTGFLYEDLKKVTIGDICDYDFGSDIKDLKDMHNLYLHTAMIQGINPLCLVPGVYQSKDTLKFVVDPKLITDQTIFSIASILASSMTTKERIMLLINGCHSEKENYPGILTVSSLLEEKLESAILLENAVLSAFFDRLKLPQYLTKEPLRKISEEIRKVVAAQAMPNFEKQIQDRKRYDNLKKAEKFCVGKLISLQKEKVFNAIVSGFEIEPTIRSALEYDTKLERDYLFISSFELIIKHIGNAALNQIPVPLSYQKISSSPEKKESTSKIARVLKETAPILSAIKSKCNGKSITEIQSLSRTLSDLSKIFLFLPEIIKGRGIDIIESIAPGSVEPLYAVTAAAKSFLSEALDARFSVESELEEACNILDFLNYE